VEVDFRRRWGALENGLVQRVSPDVSCHCLTERVA
jgi:hypothetical protein